MRILSFIEDGGTPSAHELSALFDALAPITPQDLEGDWSGGDFHDSDTNSKEEPPPVHPCHAMLENYRWAGMVVRGAEDVLPVMSWTDDGQRVHSTYWGGGQLRELKHRGVVSASLIFDCYPIIDHFRRVSDNTLMALLDAKDKHLKDAGPYFFWIRK
ncbi:transcription factor cmr1 protein [Diplodia corticola]|uniref:Transcription factor cmr1 protein n=1 Tax=Diplodia corticola TaxID=236234 RepID=A0A1J9QPJ6_9PEZI|nr:transcription factor cmr1 protein [Diplodia corticola]OJD30376.1 transcription factor cmr1 protein [Diplodia corticola]